MRSRRFTADATAMWRSKTTIVVGGYRSQGARYPSSCIRWKFDTRPVE